MIRAADIAAYVLRRAGPMTTMKLQKLVFYSHAWSLVLLDQPLFPEEVQAWAYGPVVYELFSLHRGKFVVSELEDGDLTQVQGLKRSIVEGVLGSYGKLDGLALSERTHSEAPWKQARLNRHSDWGSPAISVEAIRGFYRQQEVPFHWEGA